MAGSDPKNLKPEPKYVFFSKGKVRMYQPKPDQVTEFDLGKNRSELESYVVLGFGGSGQDLIKTFEVAYAGPETINGIATAKLELTPKSEKVRNTYKRDCSVDRPRSRHFGAAASFSAARAITAWPKYSSIRMNEKISDDVFKLKTTSKTQTVTPKGLSY